jgi:hypothetical protein
VGRFRVPSYRLPALIHDVHRIHEEYGDDSLDTPTNNDSLAHLLGYEDADNDTYRAKLAALREFGLLQGFGAHTKLSNVAKNLLDPVNHDQAYRKAAFSVTLWIELLEEFGLRLRRVEPAVLRKGLMTITGCSESEISKYVNFLLKAYDEDTKSIRAMDGRPKLIEIKAGSESIKYPLTERGKNRAVHWLKGVEIS